jgi:hypothetical protein
MAARVSSAPAAKAGPAKYKKLPPPATPPVVEFKQIARLYFDAGVGWKKDDKPTVENLTVRIIAGWYLGLDSIASVNNIAVIGGRVCLWGDSALALVRASGLLVKIEEDEFIDRDEGATSRCVVQRIGEAERVFTFSDKQAEKAGLLTKPGPWQTYRARQRQMRARSFALRDVFTDVLQGLGIAEEVKDYSDITPTAASEPAKDRKTLALERLVKVRAEWLQREGWDTTDAKAVNLAWGGVLAKVGVTSARDLSAEAIEALAESLLGVPQAPAIPTIVASTTVTVTATEPKAETEAVAAASVANESEAK